MLWESLINFFLRMPQGVMYRGIYLKDPFDLIFKGFTPETPRRATPYWRMHGGNPALGGIELLWGK
jgi:hypothetical protein